MSIAKRYIRYRNVGANLLAGFRHVNVFIRKGRSANDAQSFISDYQPPLYAQMIANPLKCPSLTLGSSLPVVDVQSGSVCIPCGQCGADT